MPIGGHTGFEFVVGIIEHDLDPVHQFYPFFKGLNRLGGKFCLTADIAYPTGIGLVGKGVGCYLDLLTQLYPAKICFMDIGTQPRFIHLPKGQYRGSGVEIFPGFCRGAEYHAVHWCNKLGILQLLSGLVDRFLGNPDFG